MSLGLGLFASPAKGGAAVSLARDNLILSSMVTKGKEKPSQTLLQIIEQTCKAGGCKISDIDVISSDIGPGSFTGIRVGLASMFGLSKGLNIKSSGISSLTLMAGAFFLSISNIDLKQPISEEEFTDTFILPLVPAGRDEFFGSVLKSTENLLPEEVTKPGLLSIDEVFRLCSDYSALVVVTDSAFLPELLCRSVKCITVKLTSCAEVAALVAVKEIDDKFNKMNTTSPLYIRRSWAEEVKDSNEK